VSYSENLSSLGTFSIVRFRTANQTKTDVRKISIYPSFVQLPVCRMSGRFVSQSSRTFVRLLISQKPAVRESDWDEETHPFVRSAPGF